MTTLIILIILFAIAIIGLIIISIKKFSDKTDYILADISILSAKLNSLDDKTTTLNDKITSILNKTTKIDSRFITLHETINDNLNNIEIAIKSLVNSINAIEEKNDVIVKILEQITEFNEHHRRVTEMLDNKIIAAKVKRKDISDKLYDISDFLSNAITSLKVKLQENYDKSIGSYEEINVIKQTLSNFDEVDCSRHQTIYNILKEIKNIAIDINNSTPNSEDIIDSDELVNRITEQLYNKINDFQAKNSLSTNKTEKASSAKSKHRTRAKKANNSYNSVHEPLQEKVNED